MGVRTSLIDGKSALKEQGHIGTRQLQKVALDDKFKD